MNLKLLGYKTCYCYETTMSKFLLMLDFTCHHGGKGPRIVLFQHALVLLSLVD